MSNNEPSSELDELYDKFLEKARNLNYSIWNTLITLHAIIISVFALTLASMFNKSSCIVKLIVGCSVIASLASIYLLFENFTSHRTIYNNLSYHLHPKNRDHENLNAEQKNANAAKERVELYEKIAKVCFYAEFIIIFVLILVHIP